MDGEVTREQSEEKVIDVITRQLPELEVPGSVITITLLDPEHSESTPGAHFKVERIRAHICRR